MNQRSTWPINKRAGELKIDLTLSLPICRRCQFLSVTLFLFSCMPSCIRQHDVGVILILRCRATLYSATTHFS